MPLHSAFFRLMVRSDAALAELREKVVRCRLCPRLVRYRERVAREKRRAFRDWEYWGKPVPGFGDPRARLLVVGLAPAAHGGNRTGRIFTGDRSGDWLYRTLHRFGFANQPVSTHANDGLELHDAYVTAVVRCAPPANKPSPDEIRNCRPYLRRELELLPVRVAVALGQVAFRGFMETWEELHQQKLRPRPRFAHGATFELGPIHLVASYHPSQRNTQTGFLTEAMFDSVFAKAARLLEEGDSTKSAHGRKG
ncbi:MAG: uracil-DNA glycosylase [Candidatus Binatia bacterium]|nr:MAG: uracil-DNA glycosylase [Candidatus Binatia bacterium]